MTACLRSTELAAPCARVAHQHDRRCRNSVLASPTLADIRTFRLLTHCRQLQLAHLLLNRLLLHYRFQQVFVVLARRQFCLQPRRESTPHLFLVGIGRSDGSGIHFVFVDEVRQFGTVLQFLLHCECLKQKQTRSVFKREAAPVEEKALVIAD